MTQKIYVRYSCWQAGSGEQGILVDNLITIQLQITEVFHSNKKGKANSASPF